MVATVPPPDRLAETLDGWLTQVIESAGYVRRLAADLGPEAPTADVARALVTVIEADRKLGDAADLLGPPPAH
jgi:hypothetical protein